MNRYKKAEIQVDKFCQLVDDLKIRTNGHSEEENKQIKKKLTITIIATSVTRWMIKTASKVIF